MMIPLVLAAALTIDFSGLSLVTPWQAPGEPMRVWVFLPDAAANGIAPHSARLRIERRFVDDEDWNSSGVWNLSGYALSVHRDGVTDAPAELRTPAFGYERAPWETLHWTLNVDRIVPEARIADNPFGPKGAIAAIKLVDGRLSGLKPTIKNFGSEQIWRVKPTANYEQVFTDAIRYVVDLHGARTELRLDPLPGTKGAPKRIRLKTDAGAMATVSYLPMHSPATGRGSAGATGRGRRYDRGHVAALAGLFADPKTREAIAALSVQRLRGDSEMGGDPICMIAELHMFKPDCPINAYCPALRPATTTAR